MQIKLGPPRIQSNGTISSALSKYKEVALLNSKNSVTNLDPAKNKHKRHKTEGGKRVKILAQTQSEFKKSFIPNVNKPNTALNYMTAAQSQILSNFRLYSAPATDWKLQIKNPADSTINENERIKSQMGLYSNLTKKVYFYK